jgi:flagellin-like hook-associated protein FlgL
MPLTLNTYLTSFNIGTTDGAEGAGRIHDAQIATGIATLTQSKIKEQPGAAMQAQANAAACSVFALLMKR